MNPAVEPELRTRLFRRSSFGAVPHPGFRGNGYGDACSETAGSGADHFYLLLRGVGDMVAGLANGKEVRHR